MSSHSGIRQKHTNKVYLKFTDVSLSTRNIFKVINRSKYSFVNIISLIFRSVNYFENGVRRQRNVSELQVNFIRAFLSNS